MMMDGSKAHDNRNGGLQEGTKYKCQMIGGR